jgi:short-subunit dehydrogenase
MNHPKVALITGASRGIGLSIAERLASEGYSLGLMARSESALKGVASKIQDEHGVAVFVQPCDFENISLIPSAVAKMVGHFGRIDVLVNNAGINVPGTLEASEEDYQRCFTVNVAAPRAIIKALMSVFLSQGSGSIINIASISGLIGFSGNGVYGSSKRALLGLNESLFNELVPQGIKVSAICPSWVATDMAAHAGFSERLMIKPDDIAETVVYLTSLSSQACVRELRIDCSHTV